MKGTYKKRLLILLLPIVLIPTLNIFSSVSANFSTPVIDPVDRLDLISPSPNSTVKDSIQVRFGIFDDEQSVINYEVRLFDYATCNTQSFGHIILPPLPNPNSAKQVSFLWNTKSTQSISLLADGNYCLRVCAALKNGTVDYSACDARQIRISNTNRLPSITSTPAKLKYNQGEVFSYQVVASDPDGDILSYRFSQTASFLTINSSTGIITSTVLSALGYESLKYPIQIIVSDGKGGEVSQNFTLEIVNPKPVVQPPPVNNGGNNNQGNPPPPNNGDNDQPGEENEAPDVEEQEDTVIDFNLLSPNQNEVVSGESFMIEWNRLNTSAKELKIEYSTDLANWILLQDQIANNQNYYLWNLEDLEDGKYYLRFSILDINNKETQKISEVFEIRKTVEGPDQNDNIPIIINLKPEPGSTIKNDFATVISGEFVPSLGSSVVLDSIQFRLGGRDYIEFCQFTEEEFICDSKAPLGAGRYSAVVTYTDSVGKQGSAEWFFNVEGQGGEVIVDENNISDSQTIVIFGREITNGALVMLLIILCIASVLLFVPWTLYSIWLRRKETEKATYATTYTTDNYIPDTNLLPNLNVYSQPVQPYEPIIAPAPEVNVNYYPVTPIQDLTTSNDGFVEPTKTS